MPDYASTLDWIATRHQAMLDRVIAWSNINSFTFNLAGLADLAELLRREFSCLGAPIEFHDLPPLSGLDARARPISTPLGEAISLKKRTDARVRVFLNIHMDTVHSPHDSFRAALVNPDRLHGPGVADAKGGLAVMLTALEALEQSPLAKNIGWEVLINPDEEIGSPGSAALLNAAAKANHLGLLFEPTLPDGAIIDRRRGTGNFSIVIRGRSAHAGRDFDKGRSAILAAAHLSLRLAELNIPGVTINTGSIDGGGPSNVVPDLAICRVNIRTTEMRDELLVQESLAKLLAETNSQDGIRAELRGQFAAPPKILDDRGRRLLDAVLMCGSDLGLNLSHRAGGGASDGNQIHTPNEFMIPSSLVERAQLTALLLMKLGSGDIDSAAFSR
jgi:glutamate carboxypeptidase